MSKTELTYLLLRMANFAAEWLKGYKDPRAWKLSLLVDVGFASWALWMGNITLVGFTAINVLIHARNLVLWQRGASAPAKTESSPSSSESDSASSLPRYLS